MGSRAPSHASKPPSRCGRCVSKPFPWSKHVKKIWIKPEICDYQLEWSPWVTMSQYKSKPEKKLQPACRPRCNRRVSSLYMTSVLVDPSPELLGSPPLRLSLIFIYVHLRGVLKSLQHVATNGSLAGDQHVWEAPGYHHHLSWFIMWKGKQVQWITFQKLVQQW
jgi:hypothetical protein